MSRSATRPERPAKAPGAGELMARYGIFLVLVVLTLALSVLSPALRGEQYFLTTSNVLQVLLQAAINLLIALGMTFVIASGGIDLSVGANVALAGLVAAAAMQGGAGTWTGLLVCLLVGTACGVLNGLLITRLGLQPFIATLGTMGIFRGLALVFSSGRPIYDFDPSFVAVFSGTLLGVPTQVWVAVLAGLLCWGLLTQTRFGKYTLAIGSREDTARLAGIPVARYKLGIYALAGLLTGGAAALLVARLGSADPTYGTSYELDAIAAAIMGGTSLSGGVATVPGTVVGALIISLVRNGMNILNVPSFWQQFVIGTVIILAVVLDKWRKRQGARA